MKMENSDEAYFTTPYSFNQTCKNIVQSFKTDDSMYATANELRVEASESFNEWFESSSKDPCPGYDLIFDMIKKLRIADRSYVVRAWKAVLKAVTSTSGQTLMEKLRKTENDVDLIVSDAAVNGIELKEFIAMAIVMQYPAVWPKFSSKYRPLDDDGDKLTWTKLRTWGNVEDAFLKRTRGDISETQKTGAVTNGVGARSRKLPCPVCKEQKDVEAHHSLKKCFFVTKRWNLKRPSELLDTKGQLLPKLKQEMEAQGMSQTSFASLYSIGHASGPP